MKKIKFLSLFISLLAITCTNNSYGFSIQNPTTNPEKYEAIQGLRISELVSLSAKQFSELTGKKMNFWDRLSFSVIKMKMKHDLKSNPNLTISDFYSGKSKHRLSPWLWVAIGLGLLLILVVVSVTATLSF